MQKYENKNTNCFGANLVRLLAADCEREVNNSPAKPESYGNKYTDSVAIRYKKR